MVVEAPKPPINGKDEVKGTSHVALVDERTCPPMLDEPLMLDIV